MGEANATKWVNIWHSAIKEKDQHGKLELFKESLEIADEGHHKVHQAASTAAIRMIQDTKGMENVVFRGAGVINMCLESEKIWWFVNPALCTSLHDFRDMVGNPEWHIIWQPMLPYSYWSPCFIIPLPLEVKTVSEEKDEREKIKIVSSIESLADRVEVPAGTFTNCIKFKNSITQEGDTCLQHVSGTAFLWFSSEAGLVKEHYLHADGDETINEIIEYSVKNNPDSPLPLNIGNTWKYKGTKKSNPVVATHIFWIDSECPDESPVLHSWNVSYYSYATYKK